jgi:hypothetical protein
MIKSFRGLLKDGGQDTIRLGTNNGLTGYRIVKFQIIDKAPGTLNTENLCKMYKFEQDSVDGVIEFTNSRLLGVAFRAPQYASGDAAIIFDNEVFNQDIFITHKDISGNASLCNYYIELEQIKLDLGEAAVATLKDMRGSN